MVAGDAFPEWHLIAERVTDHPREKMVTTDVLAKTCMGTVDFEGEWTVPYRRKLSTLLAA